MESGIYMIRNLRDGKVYIGQAANIAMRRMQHIRALRRGDHKNIRMQRAFNRDGEPAFDFSVIEFCEIERLTEREQFWIDAHSYIYNICPAGGSSLGVKRSDETREKQSALKKGKTPKPMPREAIERAAATRKANNALLPKRKDSPETCKRRSDSLKARWAEKPKKKMSEESKAKMSASAKRRWIEKPLSKETIERATAVRAYKRLMQNG